jgi:hypothetical protein
MIHIFKNKIKDIKLSIITDESPDILGRSTLSILVSFFDKEIKGKNILLLDLSIIIKCDSINVLNKIAQVLEKYGINWDDVLAISTDSAEYMRKMVKDIKTFQNKNILHVPDISHLIHVSIIEALKLEEFEQLRDVLLKFGNLFINANQLLSKFHEILSKYGHKLKKPPQVVDSRWFSYYDTALEVKDLWSYLCEFIDGNENFSSKVSNLNKILIDRQVIYIKLNYFIEILKPLKQMQLQCEKKCLSSDKFYDIYANKMSSYFNELLESDNFCKSLMDMLKPQEKCLVKPDLISFREKLYSKWNQTCERNLANHIFGNEAILKKCVIFISFRKSL